MDNNVHFEADMYVNVRGGDWPIVSHDAVKPPCPRLLAERWLSLTKPNTHMPTSIYLYESIDNCRVCNTKVFFSDLCLTYQGKPNICY